MASDSVTDKKAARKADVLKRKREKFLERMSSGKVPSLVADYISPEQLTKMRENIRNYLSAAADEKLTEACLVDMLAEEMQSSSGLRLATINGDILVYNPKTGIYGKGDMIVSTLLDLVFNVLTRTQSEILSKLHLRTYMDQKAFEQKSNSVIPFQNGVIDIKDWQFKEHSHEYCIRRVHPVKFVNRAACPRFIKFLEEVVSKDDIPVLQEYLGYCLFKGLPFQKVVMLVGVGANGKSVFLIVLRAFVGAENCASVSLQNIINNRFASAELYGKSVNIYADLSSEALRSSGLFKLITGGDSLTAERKFQQPFVFQNTTKNIFSANEVPPVNDQTDAFYRRWIIILFSTIIPPENRDPELASKLTTPEELSGILNFALEGLKRLLAKGDFSNAKSVEQVRKLYGCLSDSVSAFAVEGLQPVFNSEIDLPKYQVYGAYIEFCRLKKLISVSEEAFGRALQHKIYCRTTRPTIRGERTWCWRGFRIIAPPEAKPTILTDFGSVHDVQVQSQPSTPEKNNDNIRVEGRDDTGPRPPGRTEDEQRSNKSVWDMTDAECDEMLSKLKRNSKNWLNLCEKQGYPD